MLLNQDAQRKAQAELDSVVGDRLPEFADREQLPYVNAIYKEVLRWHPVAPLGFAHAAAQDNS
jgi:cytochrome P450